MEDLFEGIEDVMEGDMEDTLVTPALVGNQATQLVDEEVVLKVIHNIARDEILPDQMRKTILCVDVQGLVEKLQKLNDVASSEKSIFTSASKEKAWLRFHTMLPFLREDVAPLIGDLQLSTFVCLQVAEEVVKCKFQSSAGECSSKQPEGLSAAERDIISYIAGFVLFSCKKHFKTVSSIVDIIEKLTDRDGSTKLISVKSRGGLTQPCTIFIDFVMLLEFVFRSLCSSEVTVPSRQLFVNSVCQDDRVVSGFYTSTYHTNVDTASQEKLLLHAINLFHKVRCHAKCRQTMEKFHCKTKSAGKQKSLRNSIDH